MSFYGTVFYEFERLFFNFKFKNVEDTVDTVDIEAKDSVNGMTATERWDTFHIHTGNRWIRLTSMPEGNDVKGVVFSHAEAGPATGTAIPIDAFTLEEEEEPEGEVTRLTANQLFNMPEIKYDNAGHIVSAETKIMQLPDPAEVIVEGMESHFEEPIERKGIEHDIEQNADTEENAVVLEPGQVVATTKLAISEKGVITGVEDVYYKMPQSDAEAELEEITERVEVLEEDIASVTDLSGLYNQEPDKSWIDEFNRYESLVAAIGNLEASKRVLNGTDRLEETMTVAEQITQLYGLISGVNAALGNRITELDKKISSYHPPE